MMALRGYAARPARQEHQLNLLRGRAAGVALGSGGGVDGIDTGADDRAREKPGHTRAPQATAWES